MSTTLAALFLTVSQTLSLPPGLLSAVCYVESGHRTTAMNQSDGGSPSVGLCQIKAATARGMGYRGTDMVLAKPGVNAYWAGKYLRYQLDRYNGDVLKALSAYNAGTHRVNAKGEIMNRKYVAKVVNAWSESR